MKTCSGMCFVMMGLTALQVDAGRLTASATALSDLTARPLTAGAMEGGPCGIVGLQPHDALSRSVEQAIVTHMAALPAAIIAGPRVVAAFEGGGMMMGSPAASSAANTFMPSLQQIANMASTGHRHAGSVIAPSPQLTSPALRLNDDGQGRIATVVPLPPALCTGLAMLSASVMLKKRNSAQPVSKRRQV